MKVKNRTSFLDWLKVGLATIFWTCSRIDSGERPESTGGGDFKPTFPGALPLNNGLPLQFQSRSIGRLMQAASGRLESLIVL